MKNLLKSMALLSMLSLFSCSKVIYTQQQVLDTYKTKESIIKKFGAPTEKLTGDTTEEWLYSYEGRNPNTEHVNSSSINVANFNIYERFIKFTIDKQGNVLNWQCVGVDFAERKKAPGKTVALIAGGVGLIAILAWIASNNIHFSTGTYY
jgi:hypothetical protein